MDIQQLQKLRPALNRYVARFADCIKTQPSRRHLHTYLAGQLGPLERKSVEPIALDANVPPRTLQEFLAIHRWDEGAVARRHRQLIRRRHASEQAIAVIDETSFPKKGNKTAGVQRQHCGARGKVDNCVVTVHLGYVAGSFHALLDGDLFLPEESWAQERERCREAGIPDEVVYRPKWQIALDLLERALEEGVRLAWLTADEEYGRVAAFRRTVAEAGLSYVVEIPHTLTGWTRRPPVEPQGSVTRAGRILRQARLAPGAREARPVARLWKRGGPSWQLYRVKDTGKGPVVWRVRESRFFPHDDGLPGEKLRLIVAQEVLSGELKYFLSNAAAEIPLKVVLCVAFSRWHIERLFEEGKGEVGFDHFEVRKYRPLLRHLVLTMLSLYFLAEQTGWLRGGKPAVDPLPSEGGSRGATGPDPLLGGAQAPPGEDGEEDRVLATQCCEGRLLPCQAPTPRTTRSGHRLASGHSLSFAYLAL